MANGPSNHRTAIVLQGGGALGAYELGVIKAIYDQRPGFRPSAVAGISIGAITAAVLGGARGDPIATLETLWQEKLTVLPRIPGFGRVPVSFLPRDVEQSLAVLGNPGMYRFNPALVLAPWAATSIYETGPLRRTLADLVDLDTINQGDIRVIVGAMDIETAMITYFDNAAGTLAFEHVIASGSLPPGFPMTEVDGRWYWDGGLFSNTPLGPAINHLESIEPANPAIHRELVVVELFPRQAPIPRTLPDVLNRMVQMQYTSRIQLDEKLSRKIDRMLDVIEQIDKDLPANSAVRKDAAYLELAKHRRIDFKVIEAHLDDDLTNAGDFSRASVEARIDAGYDDAKRAGVGWPSD